MKNIKIPVRKVNRTSNPAPILAIGPKIMAVIEVEAEVNEVIRDCNGWKSSWTFSFTDYRVFRAAEEEVHESGE